jgi:hypothetical protein
MFDMMRNMHGACAERFGTHLVSAAPKNQSELGYKGYGGSNASVCVDIELLAISRKCFGRR